MGILNTLRNNWKKSTCASMLLGYGVYSLKSYYDVEGHMRKVCRTAAKYAGTENKNLPRNVLVVINPVANKSKSEKMFKKYCDPVLHLAGFTIDTVKTNHVGHAKTYIENTAVLPDAIVIVGGDGTASEVITGLMRREKPSCPIVILPMGKTKSSQYNKVDYIKTLTNSVLSILNGTLHSENVIKYESLENNIDDILKNKPIYGINSFKWGVLRELDVLKDKYWYFGNLRYQAAAIFNAFSEKLSWKCSADVIYTPPCSGCSNCCANVSNNNSQKGWIKVLHNRKLVNADSKYNIINENCTKAMHSTVNTSQLTITPLCNTDHLCQLVTESCKTIDPGLDFIKTYFPNMHSLVNDTSSIKSRTIQIIPTSLNEDTFFSIDGEEYEVRPIKISLIPKAIQICV